MDLGLTNFRILVTGSSRGIGYAIASAFLGEGATVFLTGRDEQSLRTAQGVLANKFGRDRVQMFAGDLSDVNVRNRLRK